MTKDRFTLGSNHRNGYRALELGSERAHAQHLFSPPEAGAAIPTLRARGCECGSALGGHAAAACAGRCAHLALAPHSGTAPRKLDMGPGGRTYTMEMGKRPPWRAGCWTITGTARTADKKVKRLGLEPTSLSLPTLCF